MKAAPIGLLALAVTLCAARPSAAQQYAHGPAPASAHDWTADQYFAKVCFGTQASPTGGVAMAGGVLQLTTDCNATLASVKLLGLQIPTVGNSTLWKIRRDNSGADELFQVGYNPDSAVAADWSWNLQFESAFLGTTEFILSYGAPNGGTTRRPIFVTVDKTTHAASLNLAGQTAFKTSAGTAGPLTIEDAGQVLINGGNYIYGISTNQQFLKGKTVGAGVGGFYALPFINSNDRTSISVDGQDTLTGGRLGVGAAPAAVLDIEGPFSPAISGPGALNVASTITPTNNSDVYYAEIQSKVTTPASVTTNTVQGLRVDVPSITLGAGSALTTASSVYVAGAPTVGTTKWGLFVDGTTDTSRFAGNLQVGGTYNNAGAQANFGGAIRLPNNLYLYGRNAANSADVAIVKLNTGNEIQFDTNVNIGSGATLFPVDIRATGKYRCVSDAGCDVGQSVSVGRPANGWFATQVTTPALNLTGLAGAAAGDIPLCLSTGNAVHTAAATCGTSAARFKQHIEPATLGLAAALRLRPVTFELKPEYRRAGAAATTQVGFIADDLAVIDPRLVHYQDGQVINYDDRALIAVLAKALQEQQAQIDALRRELRRGGAR